jgi:uncharacterized lipoprotein YddW (UPF0748 family)
MAFIRKTLFVILILHNFTQASSKAIWVVRDALTSDQQISKIVKNAKLLHCDKIFLQLRALGYVYYPTQLDIPHKKVDPGLLKNLFNDALKNNIEVHVWLNVCYVWPNKKLPQTQNHVLNKVSSAIIQPVDPSIKPEGYYLHPNDKWNLSEVKTIMDELLRLYPVAGFHLDYFRYPKERIHTSKLGRTEFIIEYGLDPLIPLQNPEKFSKERGFESYSYFQEKYSNFLRDELTLALTDIRNFLKSKNKHIQLSIAVKPNPIGAKHHFFQDWALWLQKDLCDFVVTMNYNPEMKTFINNLNIINQKADTTKIMIGIATYNIDAKEISQRIMHVKNTSYNGYVLFSYNYIKDRKELFNLLRN